MTPYTFHGGPLDGGQQLLRLTAKPGELPEFRLTWGPRGNQYVYMPLVDGGTDLYFVQVLCRGRTK